MHQQKFASREHKGRKAAAESLLAKFNDLFGCIDAGTVIWANIPITKEHSNGQIPLQQTEIYALVLKHGLELAKNGHKLPDASIMWMTEIKNEVLSKIKNPATREKWREDFVSFAQQLIESNLVKRLGEKDIFGLDLSH